MTTLEARVEQRLAGFRAAEARVPELQQRVQDLRQACEAAEGYRQRELRAELDSAQAELDRLVSGKDEIEYLLDIAPIIRDYDTVEAVAADPQRAGKGIESFVQVTHKSNKQLVLQRYLAEIEKRQEYMPKGTEPRGLDTEMTCDKCKAPYVVVARESSLVCESCGVSRSFMEMSESNMSYEQEIATDVVNYFAYKRLNHMSEWLNSLQAKENTEIPPEIIEAVRAEFKKARATTRGEIKPAKVREYLKKLKLNKVRGRVTRGRVTRVTPPGRRRACCPCRRAPSSRSAARTPHRTAGSGPCPGCRTRTSCPCFSRGWRTGRTESSPWPS